MKSYTIANLKAQVHKLSRLSQLVIMAIAPFAATICSFAEGAQETIENAEEGIVINAETITHFLYALGKWVVIFLLIFAVLMLLERRAKKNQPPEENDSPTENSDEEKAE